MRLKDKKYAFSLTELLIVLVVLAVLFAALAPILTTRHNGASVSTENIWNYVNSIRFNFPITRSTVRRKSVFVA